MKIRMSRNSLRLRLAQKEIDQLYHERKVTTTTKFGPGPNNSLQYSLIKDKMAETIKAVFENGEILVVVPESLADTWVSTEQEGFETKIPLEGNEELYILVEKDFRCLHKRSDEEDADAFPNPREGKMSLDCD